MRDKCDCVFGSLPKSQNFHFENKNYKLLAEDGINMIEEIGTAFLRWFQEETDVPKNRRIISKFWVMKTKCPCTLGSGKVAYLPGTGLHNKICFWFHRCSHKLIYSRG